MDFLRLGVSEDGGAQPAVLSARGEIDMLTAAEFEAALAVGIARAEQAASRRCLIVDLSEIAFCSNAGARALAYAEHDAIARGVDLRVVAIGMVRRVLDLTQVSLLLNLYDTVDTALSG